MGVSYSGGAAAGVEPDGGAFLMLAPEEVILGSSAEPARPIAWAGLVLLRAEGASRRGANS